MFLIPIDFYFSGLYYFDGVYHVSNAAPTFTLIELVTFSLGKYVPVGADVVDSSVFLHLLGQNGLDAEYIVRTVLAKQELDPTSVVRKGVIDALCERSDRSIRNPQKFDKITVPYELTAPEQSRLLNSFPEFQIIFPSSTNGHPNAYSAASRVCETQLAL